MMMQENQLDALAELARKVIPVPVPEATASSGKDSSNGNQQELPSMLVSQQDLQEAAMMEVQTMLPRPGDGSHQYAAAALEYFDREYARQASANVAATGRACYVAAAGKAGEHFLRSVGDFQAMRNGLALKKLVKGSRRMPLLDEDGSPLYLKKLIAANLARKDLKLGVHFVSGHTKGTGLTPTAEIDTLRLAFPQAVLSLKTSYTIVLSGVANAMTPVARSPPDGAAAGAAGAPAQAPPRALPLDAVANLPSP